VLLPKEMSCCTCNYALEACAVKCRCLGVVLVTGCVQSYKNKSLSRVKVIISKTHIFEINKNEGYEGISLGGRLKKQHKIRESRGLNISLH